MTDQEYAFFREAFTAFFLVLALLYVKETGDNSIDGLTAWINSRYPGINFGTSSTEN